MRLKFINFLKRHRKIAELLWASGRKIVSILIFLFPKQQKILFTSFAGRNFNDSPKALYDALCKDAVFNEYDFVWAFSSTDKFEIPRGRKVKIDTFPFFYELITARVWISNSGMDRGMGLLTKRIININTWHGTPLKKLGEDITSNECIIFKPRSRKDTTSIYCTQSNHDYKIFKKMFNADDSCFLHCDLPRNDVLTQYSSEDVRNIKNRLGIDRRKKIILYAPTFREYAWNKEKENFIAPPISMDKWESKLSDKYILLIKAHYAVTASLGIENSKFCMDVSDYPDINDLYIISDILISDYSSVYFDYSILKRPMLCFAYDMEEYLSKRGVYEDVMNDLPCEISENEDDLLRIIENLDYEELSKKANDFHLKYTPSAGHATQTVIETLKQALVKG